MLGERCQVSTSLDEKGRIGLPARLKKKLTDAGIDMLVLTSVDGGIFCFEESFFEEHIESRHSDLDPFDPRARAYNHAVLAGAEDCAVDGQGRLRIPPRLRTLAGIDRDVVVISLRHWLEIWDPKRWDERHALDCAQHDADRLKVAGRT